MDKVLEFLEAREFILQLGLYIVILIPIIFDFILGLVRGFRRALWRLIMRVAMLLIFILTLNKIADLLFNANLFGLPKAIEGWLTGASSDTTITFKDLSHSLQAYYLQEMSEDVALNAPYFIALVDSLVRYAIKIIWAILYFLIISPIVRLLLRLTIFNIFFKGRKEFRKIHHESFLGGLLGAINGLTRSFVIMVGMSGLFSLIAYNGQTQELLQDNNNDSTVQIEESAGDINRIELSYTDNGYQLLLLDEGENILEDLPFSPSEMIDDSLQMMKLTTRMWEENKLVKFANSVYFKEEIGKDNEGNPVYEKQGILNKVFDEIIYLRYTVEDDELLTDPIDIKVNLVTDINNILQSALYIIDNSEALNDDGSIDFTKIDSEKVEQAFSHLSNVKLFKVGIIVGSNIIIEKYTEDEDSFLNDKDFQRQLYSTDFTKDLKALGKFVGGLFDLGLGEFINENNNRGEEEELQLSKLLEIFLPKIKSGETLEEYNSRTEKGRNKIKEGAENLNILDVGSSVISTYIFKDLLKDQVTEMGLFDRDLNIEGDIEKTYIDKFCEEINLSRDFGTLMELVYDLADFNNNEGKIDYVINKYKNAIEGEDGVTLDEIANLINTKILPKFSRMTFIQSGMDIVVKILTDSLKNNETLGRYLTEENIFHTYINWSQEIGEKIPNLVDAIITSDFLATVDLKFNDDSGEEKGNLLNKLFERGNVSDLFRDTIDSLFKLKLISNLQDTCLKPLIEELVEGMSTDGFKISLSDDIENYGDELILFTELIDDMLLGAKKKGCKSFDDLTNNLTYLVAGFTNIDGLKIESSKILAPTIISILSNNSIELLKVPYRADSKDENDNSVWYTVLDENDNILSYGEIFKMTAALKQIDNINTLLSNSGIVTAITSLSGDCTDRKSHINHEPYESWCYKDGSDTLLKSRINVLLDSSILRCTISNFITSDNLDNGFFSIPEDDIEKVELLNEDSTTTYEYYLKEDSLVELFESLLVLLENTNISSLDSLDISMVSNILSMNEEDLNNALSSRILSLTITGFIDGIEQIIIPKTVDDNIISTTVNTIKLDENRQEILETKEVITKQELIRLVKALSKVFDGNMDLNNIGIDTFKSLSNLNEEDLDTLSSSYILNASLTSLLKNAFQGEAINTVIIPSTAVTSYKTKTLETKYMITKDEFKKLITAIGYFDFDNFKDGSTSNAFQSFKDLTRKTNIIEHGEHLSQLEVVLKSEILHSTISSVVMNLEMGGLNVIIPSNSLDDSVIYKLDSENLTYSTLSDRVKNIKVSELSNLLESISYIDVNGFSSGNNQFDTIKSFTKFISLNSTERKVDIILESDIIRSTLSNYIINMNTTAFDVLIPLEYVEEIKNAKNDENIYTIKKEDDLHNDILKTFVMGISSLDLAQLQNDTIGAIRTLSDASKINPAKTNIDMIISSKILLYTLSSYVLDKIDSLGFTSVAIPMSDIESPSAYDKENPSITLGKEVKIINDHELNNFVKALKNIDLKNISTDPLNTLKSLNDIDEFNELYESSILSLSVSKELIKFASNGDDWKFILPKQSFVLDGDDTLYIPIYRKDEILEETRKIDGNEFFKLINAINKIDINNLTSEKILEMSEEDFNVIINSTIFHANISEKIEKAIESNANINSYYDNTVKSNIKNNEVLFSDNVSSAVYDNSTITKEELKHVFNSMKVLSSNDLASLKLNYELLYNFTDDEILNNDGTVNRFGYIGDDIEENDVNDNRAKFLRSYFIRYAINKNLKLFEPASFISAVPEPFRSALLAADLLPKGYSTFLLDETVDDENNPGVHLITKYFDTEFFDEDRLTTNNDNDKNLYLSDLNILTYENVTQPLTNPSYRLTVDGKQIEHPENTGTDLNSVLTSIGEHTISLSGSGQFLDYSNILDIKFKIYKPINYNIKYKTTIGALSDIVDVTKDDTTISFDKVDNATGYIIEFIDEFDNSKFVEINTTNNVSYKFKDILDVPGKYHFTITPIPKNNAYTYNVYNSTGIIDNIVINKTIETPEYEIIKVDDNPVLFISSVNDATNYKVTINAHDYIYNTLDLSSNDLIKKTITVDEYDFIRYTYPLNNLFNSVGIHEIDIEVSNENTNYIKFNTDNETSLKYNVLTKVREEDIKLDETLNYIEIPVTSDIDKYIVEIKQINNLLEKSVYYKEIIIDPLEDTILISTKSLFKGYKYNVYVEPIKSDGYYENTISSNEIVITKVLDAPSHNKVNDSYVFTFKEVEDAKSYIAYLYKENSNTETYEKITGKEYILENNDEKPTIFEMFGEIFEDFENYKITIKALPESTNDTLIESIESIGAEFTYYPE
ncbi:hypothetical protein J6Y73_01770 [bacterium]|nr:hypothetical protein [bacterium]